MKKSSVFEQKKNRSINKISFFSVCSFSLKIFFAYFLIAFTDVRELSKSKQVPDLRIGVVGTYTSGKSALVHRYLTGSYLQDESPEGGRFKKEVIIDGQSYLLLIRDEGGPPEMQVSQAFFSKFILCHSS